MVWVHEIQRWEQMINQVVCGHVLDALKLIPDESIDCIITSPPYWGLRFYGDAAFTVWDGDPNCSHEWEPCERQGLSVGKNTPKVKIEGKGNSQIVPAQQSVCRKCGAWYGQLGLEDTLEMYIEHLLQVTAELKRILKPSGVMFWNHGDNFMSARTARNRIPRKSLCLQNYRLVMRMIDEQGWILRNIIIWHIPNAMPESVKDRFVVDYEPIFFFVKSPNYYFEQQFEPYEKPLNRWGGDILVADGKSSWDEGTGQNTYRTRNLRPNPLGRIKRCVWSIPTEPLKEEHFAAYPTKLIEPLIRAGCPAKICTKCGQPQRQIWETQIVEYRPRKNEKYEGGSEFMSDKTTLRSITQKVLVGYTNCGCKADFVPGIVLDPFLGSGTTAIVARQLGRRWIGIEINPDYCKIAEKRLKALSSQPTLFHSLAIEANADDKANASDNSY